jgi:hypothetical protein
MPIVPLKIVHEDAALNRILSGFRPSRVTLLIGGAARALYSGETVKDYDFAFGSPVGRDEFIAHLATIGALKVAETRTLDDHLTCEDFVLEWVGGYAYIQVKHEFYSSLEDLFAGTDLTLVQFCCMISMNGKKLAASEQGLADYDNRVLRLHNVTAPVSSKARWEKFRDRGFVPVDQPVWDETSDVGLKNKRYSREFLDWLIRTKGIS